MNPEKERAASFRQELVSLLNRYSRENGSDTPDYVLADYLIASLAAFDAATKARTEWYRPETEDE